MLHLKRKIQAVGRSQGINTGSLGEFRRRAWPAVLGWEGSGMEEEGQSWEEEETQKAGIDEEG